MDPPPTAPLIIRTEAIALRISPYSRTSHVVTWLSPEHGRVTTVVKGACRPKSAFLGQYDLFATCELLFYRRDHDGVHAIRECAPLEPRNELRDNWRRITTASYLCDLLARVAQPAQESADLFRLLGSTLDSLCRRPPTANAILRFELTMLRHLGLLPPFELCPACHTPSHPWLRFALASGRAHCKHAAPPVAGEPTITLHKDVVEHLQFLAGQSLRKEFSGGIPAQREPDATAPARPTRQTRDAQIALAGISPASAPDAAHLSLGSRRFLGIFMRCHLETPPATRRLAFELLESVPASFGAAKGESR